MTVPVPRTAARVLLAVALAFGAGACSASAEVDSSAATTTNEVTAAATEAPVAPEPTAAPVPTATPEPAAVEPAAAASGTDETAATTETESPAEETGNGTIEIAFDDGRSWTLNTIDCYTAPDAAFGIFFMVGRNDDGADLSAVESWPLDGDKTGGTAFIASFYDEDGGLYAVTGGPVTDAGGTLSFSSPIYEGFSLEPFTNGTFTCTP